MSFFEVDIVKIEKEKAMLRYRRFHKLTKIARTLEFCFIFLFLSWSISRTSTYFPVIIELSGFFLRRFCTLVVSHRFVFIIGNLIVFTLFFKSGHSASNDDDDSLIPQFVASCQVSSAEVVSYEKKSAVEDPLVLQFVASSEVSDEKKTEITVKKRDRAAKRSRRSKSEQFELDLTEKNQFKRSETEPRRRLDSSKEESTASRRMTVEDLSNEEFQRKVEAFIEQQQRFLREEELSMVMRNPSSSA